MDISLDGQTQPRSPQAASQPLTPNRPSPRRARHPPSPNPSDDEVSETPRRPRLPSDTVEDLASLYHSSSTHIPHRHKTNFLTPSMARPHTSAGMTTLPPMQRAYSSPGLDSSGRYLNTLFSAPRRPSSPLSSGRRRSPLRSSFEETYPSSYSGLTIEPNIPEHAELEISSPVVEQEEEEEEDGLGPLATIPSYSNTFPRSRRRPTSPLHQSASAPSLFTRATSPHLSGGTSPALSASRFTNEPYPQFSYSSTSSMPSTPTSFRSRSPSISSLETIEDIPDAEEAAMLENDEFRLNETENQTESRRKSLDLRAAGLRSNKERKRWSVCGAERRADFSLEPIEE